MIPRPVPLPLGMQNGTFLGPLVVERGHMTQCGQWHWKEVTSCFQGGPCKLSSSAGCRLSFFICEPGLEDPAGVSEPQGMAEPLGGRNRPSPTHTHDTHKHAYAHITHVCVYTRACMHTYTHIHAHTHIHTHAHSTHGHVHACSHIHTHAHLHTHTPTHTHTHTPATPARPPSALDVSVFSPGVAGGPQLCLP